MNATAPYIPLTAVPREDWTSLVGAAPTRFGMLRGVIRHADGAGRVRVGDAGPVDYTWGTEQIVSPAVDPAEVEIDLREGWSAVVRELVRQLRPESAHLRSDELRFRRDHGAWAIVGPPVPLVWCTDAARADWPVPGVEHVTDRAEALVQIWNAGVRLGRLALPGRLA